MKNPIPCIVVLAVVSTVISGCSQSSREEAIDRVSDAAKTLNGKTDNTPDVVKAQQKKDRERQNTQWTAENITGHPLEACNAKLDEIGVSEQKALVHYNKCIAMKNAAERAQRGAEADAGKFNEFLAMATPVWKDASASGKWPVTINGYSFSQEELKSKIIEAGKKKAAAQQRRTEETAKAAQAEQAMRQIQAARKRLAEEKERVQKIKRDVELGQFQNDLAGFQKAINGGVSLDTLEAVGQTAGANLAPDVFAPSASKEDEDLFRSIIGE